MTTIYLVRHGETLWNKEGKLQGQADSKLTKQGEKQAQDRASDLAQVEFDHIFASDLARTMTTAQILKADRDMAVLATNLLRERSFGRFEGATYEDFRNQLGEKLDALDALPYKDQIHFKTHEDIESDGELIDRGLRFIRETALAHPGETILMVSHGGMMQALLWRFGVGIQGEINHRIQVHNLGYFILQTDGVEMEVQDLVGVEVIANS